MEDFLTYIFDFIKQFITALSTMYIVPHVSILSLIVLCMCMFGLIAAIYPGGK